MTEIPLVLNAIRKAYPDVYLEMPVLPPPKTPTSALRGIVLGTDPSTPEHRQLKIVFALDEDHRYFANILRNLKKLGLDETQLYIQNVCRNYFTVEAPNNEHWEEVARKYWAVPLTEELDQIDPTRQVPVFATAEIIVRALANEPDKVKSAEDLYEDERIFMPDENLLHRTLVPLFRHFAYSLDDWPEYAVAIRKILH